MINDEQKVQKHVDMTKLETEKEENAAESEAKRRKAWEDDLKEINDRIQHLKSEKLKNKDVLHEFILHRQFLYDVKT